MLALVIIRNDDDPPPLIGGSLDIPSSTIISNPKLQTTVFFHSKFWLIELRLFTARPTTLTLAFKDIAIEVPRWRHSKIGRLGLRWL